MKFNRGCWGLVVLLAATALAQTQPEPAATGPVEDVAAMIAPFVDDQTVLVAHADASKIDTAAALAYVQKVLPQIQIKESPAEASRLLAQGRTMAEGFLTAFRQAGGRHAFYVMAHSDAWPAMQGGAVLVPLEAGRDPQIMMTLLKPFCGQVAPVLLKGNVIAIGPQAPVERLKMIKASARADIVQALGVASASAVQVIATPTADNRRVLREMMPALPTEIGGGSTEFIHEGLKFVCVSLVWPPTVELSIQSEFTQTAYAGQCKQAIEQCVLAALAKPETKAAMTQPGGEMIQTVVDLVGNPVMGGASVGYRLNEKQINDIVFKVLAPSLGRARDQARRVASMQRLKDLVTTCHRYVNDKSEKKIWPESLQDLVSANMAKPDQLVSPSDPKQRQYVYRKPSAEELKKKEWMELPVIWEQVDDDVTPMSVGFLDGHSETFNSRVSARKAFERVGVTLP